MQQKLCIVPEELKRWKGLYEFAKDQGLTVERLTKQDQSYNSDTHWYCVLDVSLEIILRSKDWVQTENVIIAQFEKNAAIWGDPKLKNQTLAKQQEGTWINTARGSELIPVDQSTDYLLPKGQEWQKEVHLSVLCPYKGQTFLPIHPFKELVETYQKEGLDWRSRLA